jgi:hypothetical protein
MVFLPLHVDVCVAWLVRLAASRIRLRRFGRRGKTDPGESAMPQAAAESDPGDVVANWTNTHIILWLGELGSTWRECVPAR